MRLDRRALKRKIVALALTKTPRIYLQPSRNKPALKGAFMASFQSNISCVTVALCDCQSVKRR